MYFLFVFFFIFAAYAFTRNILYGHQLEEFASIEKSATTCFLMLLGDSVDIYSNELVWIQPVFSFIWWFTYLVFGMLTLLQMLVAIIMDSYASAQRDARESSRSPYQRRLQTFDLNTWLYSHQSCQGKSGLTIDEFRILVQHRVELTVGIDGGSGSGNVESGKGTDDVQEVYVTASELAALTRTGLKSYVPEAKSSESSTAAAANKDRYI